MIQPMSHCASMAWMDW